MIGFIVEWAENGVIHSEAVLFEITKPYNSALQTLAKLIQKHPYTQFWELCGMVETDHPEIIITAFQPILSRATLQ